MSDWLDAITGYAQQGADVYATVAGARNNRPTTPAPTTPATTTPSWILPAAIGGVLLVVVLVIMGRK